MIAHELHQANCRKFHDIFHARTPKGRHHGHQVITGQSLSIPLVPQILAHGHLSLWIVFRKQEQVPGTRMKTDHVPEEGVKFGIEQLGRVRQEARQRSGRPLDGVSSVEGNGEGHVARFWLHGEGREPFCHVGVIGGVVHHESAVDVHFIVVVICSLVVVVLVFCEIAARKVLGVQSQSVGVATQPIGGFEDVDFYFVVSSAALASFGLGVKVPGRGEAGDPSADDGDSFASRWSGCRAIGDGRFAHDW